MKILVTGANGQLGHDVVKELEKRKIDCVGVDFKDFDITNKEETCKYIKNCYPDAVIHCAAYTAVDMAQDDKEKCFAVNSNATANIAKCVREIDAKMIYISTDYVFGDDGKEFLETNAPKNPKNIYGISKLEGEKAVVENVNKHFIVRTSWVFGENGNNFVKTMMRVGKERDKVCVVSDQIGSPTYSFDLAKLLCDMVVSEKYGVYHATNEDICSWADFCKEIFRLCGINTPIERVTTKQYAAKADRPKNSRLSKKSLDKAGFERLPAWQDALRRYVEILLK